MAFDTVEVWGSSPHGPTIPQFGEASNPNSRCVVINAVFTAFSSMTKEMLHSEDPWAMAIRFTFSRPSDSRAFLLPLEQTCQRGFVLLSQRIDNGRSLSCVSFLRIFCSF